MSSPLLSVVVPLFNEEECVEEFFRQTESVLRAHNISYELVLIDDGSRDRTVQIVRDYAKNNPQVKFLILSYNHGKQAALTAGISHATGQYVLMMDPDLQDPPEEIPRFLAKIQEGYDLVFGTRKAKADTFLNTLFSKLFWATLERFTKLSLPKNLAVMRIFSQQFAQNFLRFSERNRFIEGIFMKVGMRRSSLEIVQQPRFAGESKFNMRRKISLALNAILDFSDLPLKAAVYLGGIMVLLGIAYGATVIVLRTFFFDFQLGWPSLALLLIMGFGLNLSLLGLVGLYVGKVYTETKGRPLFSLQEKINFES